MASEIVLAVDQTKLQQSESMGNTALALLRDAPCDTAEQEQAFVDYMRRAHIIIQDLEGEREIAVRPLIDDKSKIDSLYRAARGPWESIKAVCKRKIAAREQARRKLEDEARRQAVLSATTHDSAAFSVATSTLAALREVAPPPIAASVTWQWVVKETHKGRMPIEYLCPDESRLAAVCRLAKNQENPPVISGVVFERIANVGVR